MIVVVILSILATVWFISYEDYLVDTRDSKRLAQLTGLRDWLRLATTRWKLPLPDDAIEIRNGWNTFLYQWYAGEDALSSISYSESTIDPLDDTYYTYLLSNNRKDFQLMWFLEKYNQSVISFMNSDVYAAEDYSQRYPNTAWKKLWIVLEQNTNTPLQEMQEYSAAWFMDLQDATTNQFDAYVTDTYLISGKEEELIWIIPYTTCKKILESGGSYGNWIYNINPSWLNPFEVYCDMEVDGGWWTLIWRSLVWANIWDFWWMVSNGNIRDDSVLYSLWSEVVNMWFSEIMLSTYTTSKEVVEAIKVDVDRSFIKDPSNYASDQLTSNCEEVYPLTSWRSACDIDGEDGKIGTRNFARYWWYFEKPSSAWNTDNRFHFRNSSGTNYWDFWLARNWYIAWDSSGVSSAFWEFEWKQWMIFVR